jgi:hypothetical protein
MKDQSKNQRKSQSNKYRTRLKSKSQRRRTKANSLRMIALSTMNQYFKGSKAR